MKLGFAFTESMSGSYHLLSSPVEEKAIRFTIRARVSGLRQFARSKTATLEGELEMEGFAQHARARGTLGLKMLDEQRAPYAMSFVADDGNTYEFRGERDFVVAHMPESLTVLPASIYTPEGKELARATLRFDARVDLKELVRSFRLTLGSDDEDGGIE